MIHVFTMCHSHSRYGCRLSLLVAVSVEHVTCLKNVLPSCLNYTSHVSLSCATVSSTFCCCLFVATARVTFLCRVQPFRARSVGWRCSALLQRHQPCFFVVCSRVHIVNSRRSPPRPEKTLSTGSKWQGVGRSTCKCFAKTKFSYGPYTWMVYNVCIRGVRFFFCSFFLATLLPPKIQRELCFGSDWW